MNAGRTAKRLYVMQKQLDNIWHLPISNLLFLICSEYLYQYGYKHKCSTTFKRTHSSKESKEARTRANEIEESNSRGKWYKEIQETANYL